MLVLRVCVLVVVVVITVLFVVCTVDAAACLGGREVPRSVGAVGVRESQNTEAQVTVISSTEGEACTDVGTSRLFKFPEV